MRFLLFILTACLTIFAKVHAQTVEDKPFELNGSLQLDDRIRLKSGGLDWQEYRMSLQPVYKVNDKARLHADIWIRKLITASPFDQPVENVQLREAYIDLYGFLSEHIDVRIGRQRIAWGTADRLNPSDNINPWELEDFWDFGRHTPTNSLLAKYYWNGFTLTAVFTPRFSPSLLPDQSWKAAFMPEVPDRWQIPLPDGTMTDIWLQPLSVSRMENLPERKLKASTYAVKIARDIRNYTVSFGWLRQYAPIPVLTRLSVQGKITSLPTSPDMPVPMNTTVDAMLSYSLRNVVNADFSGSLGSVGVWGEAALFIPEKTILTRSISIESPMGTFNPVLPDSTIFDGNPYLKYTLGFDYTFPANIYLNVQYVHGFFHEEGRKSLTDWLAWTCEWKSADEKLKLSLLNGAFQVADFNNIKEGCTLFWLPELSYKPVDNVELKAGAHCIFAGKDAPFYPIRKNGDAYLKVKYSF